MQKEGGVADSSEADRDAVEGMFQVFVWWFVCRHIVVSRKLNVSKESSLLFPSKYNDVKKTFGLFGREQYLKVYGTLTGTDGSDPRDTFRPRCSQVVDKEGDTDE